MQHIKLISSSFVKANRGQIRVTAAFIAFLVLFSLALAYNGTILERDHEDLNEVKQDVSNSLSENLEKNPETNEELVFEPETVDNVETHELEAVDSVDSKDSNSMSENSEKVDLEPVFPEVINSSEPRLIDTRESSEIEPENGMVNQSIPINVSEKVNQTIENISIPVNQTVNRIDSDLFGPELEIELTGEKKVVRGGNTAFEATVTNKRGIVRDVVLLWLLPDGTTQKSDCGNLDINQTCVSTIEFNPALVLSLGSASVDVKISYETWRESSG
ncbi:hypothetical protein K8R43_03275 [archaeon]|nr:hypothetical protein [archaeon]